MKKHFTDYHCHLLPSVDDGSTDFEESVAMARILAGAGFSVVHCTPHRIKGCYENEPEAVRQATRFLQRQVHDAGIDLALVPGTEHYLDEFLIDQLADALTTGAARYLLVEAPFRSGLQMLPSMVAGVIDRGMVPLIAHPERCSVFDPGPANGNRGGFSFLRGKPKRQDLSGSLVMSLRASGCRFQGNLGSFAGFYGSEIKERALLFLKEGVYSCVGSDAHRSDHLGRLVSEGMGAVVGAVGEESAFDLFAGRALL
ncbi:MAG TPA: CpsB/CapC family capsule biosynthesis tyrosine phosphatase [Geomonas sp.]|nr:CpsB/CapC family capsule biosynthesis tyrosine phosphatase [Geomonas sp.]